MMHHIAKIEDLTTAILKVLDGKSLMECKLALKLTEKIILDTKKEEFLEPRSHI